ncbi:MAG: HAMP domain-containing sensor histidine kinase [Bacteroidota bacterium]
MKKNSILAKMTQWTEHRAYRYGSDAVLLGFFIYISYMFPSFTIKAKNINRYIQVLVILRIVGVALCTGLLLKNQWPKFLQPYYYLFYFATILFCLPYTNTLLFLEDPKDPLALSLFTLHLLLLIILVDWRAFFTIAIIGVILATLTYRFITRSFLVNLDFETSWNLIFSSLFTFLVGLLFARRKESNFLNTILRTKLLSGALGHEVLDKVNESHIAAQATQIQLEHLRTRIKNEKNIHNQEIYQLFRDLLFNLKVVNNANIKIQREINQAKELIAYENVKSSDLISMSMKRIVQETYDQLTKQYKQKVKLDKNSTDFVTIVPKKYFKNIIFNLIKNAVYHGKATEIIISWNAKKHTLSVTNNGSPIPESVKSHIYELFCTTKENEAGSGIGLSFVKALVESAGGSMNPPEQTEQGVKFTIQWS